MSKIPDKQKKPVKKVSKNVQATSLIITIIVALYAIVPVFTPNFYTLDSNGPKFLALAILNFFSLCVIFFYKKINPGTKDPVNFIKHPVGIMISLLLLISLISFTRVINIYEFLITFSKIVTTFTAALILFIIFRTDHRFFKHLLIILGVILFIDCLSVFYGTYLYIERKIELINDVKSVYSNKNILASAIFVKVPVAIWLHLHATKRWKFVSLLLLLFTFTAILLLSARAFYMGTVFVTLVYLAFLLLRYFKEKDKSFIRFAIEYVAVLSIAVLLFSFTQASLFPNPTKTDQYNRNIAERISSITEKRGSSNRDFYWRNSWELIKDHPLMGVGLGNWKIIDLKYENRTSQDKNYIYHAHNDFIETTAETGVFGGLAYLLIFIYALFSLAKTISGKLPFAEPLFIFISSLGLLCYGVDAFFNFPSDRAEIQLLFSIYLGSFIFFTSIPGKNASPGKTKTYSVFLIHSLVLIYAVFCLSINFISLRYQRITKDDILRKKYTQTSEYMLQGFPFMPDISSYGEPLVCFKSRYLTNEKKYDQAIRLLQNDKSSPYDPRVPEFICINYNNWGMMDSSLKYAEKCITMKPAFYLYTQWACDMHNRKGEYEKSFATLNAYIKKTRSIPKAWNDLSELYAQINDGKKSVAALDSGLIFCPGDSLLMTSKATMLNYFKEKKYKKQFQEGDSCFNKKYYKNAITFYTRILDQDTSLLKAYEFRGLSLFYLKEYMQAVMDFSTLIRRSPLSGKYYNDRGACYSALEKHDDACSDFKKAIDLGDSTAVSNYKRYCTRK